MRVALGSFAGLGDGSIGYDYPFPRGSFTLANGRMVDDPATEAPEGDDCLPYICGVAADDPVTMWCSFYGHSGAKAGCVDPACEPWRGMIPYCSLPQVPPANAFSLPAPVIPALTPANIVQPLPSITTVLEPQPVQPDCGAWAQLNGAIAEHPGIALAALAALALAVFVHHKKGRRL